MWLCSRANKSRVVSPRAHTITKSPQLQARRGDFRENDVLLIILIQGICYLPPDGQSLDIDGSVSMVEATCTIAIVAPMNSCSNEEVNQIVSAD